MTEKHHEEADVYKRQPLGRVGSGEEIAAAVCFACSDAASWMTGVDIPVDGGFSILGPDRGISPRAWFKQLAP